MNTAQLEGASWGTRAQDWAQIQELTMRPAPPEAVNDDDSPDDNDEDDSEDP